MSEFTVAGLRVVREAARHGSFSTAGERLGYTQSAVSRQIALMEQAAGRPLFERQARGVRLTEAGRVVLRHAEAVLGELDSVRQELEDLTVRPPVRLRVGAFSTAMAALVPRAIAALVAARPQVAVSLREGPSGRLLTSVARGRLDLAVVTPPRQAPEGVEIIPVLEDPLFVAMSPRHPLADLASAPIGMFREERWIVGSAEPGTTLLGAWSDVSWEPEIAFVAKDWVAKLGFVAAGLGVTVVPGLIVPVLPPDVAVVRIDHPAAVRTTAIARPGDRSQDEPRREFGELLRDMSAELAADLRRRLR
ncbi:LysR substrate-binding domain-containing protein [Amycolatopsis cynarae]|uniref:LysR substrate-binding domain-containing protein n=1 Tax=Amycolatopsis cynarae TaxID=2995223 RepID=A0ABY7AZF9_9PSEU|nr:LysR substrate-binding domain-containing protein [Amycolatopsis sp. HUAS 11-8]WAL65331.1 LysR substrate-binding domain-containing protein [Amycolatopsis sp. HUAS 11-8]